MRFSVTKAKDREVMAQIVEAIFVSATSIRSLSIESEGARRIAVRFTHGRGAAVRVEFDGDSRQDRDGEFCMPWHIDSSISDACFDDLFGLSTGGTVNQHHFSKCTAFADGFDDLCERLRQAVAMLDSGEGYSDEREAASIAQHGTWQDRAAQWAKWREEFAAECAAKRASAAA